VRHVIEYKAEMTVGALLEIKADVLELGNKSVKTLYEMHDSRSGQIAATLEATTVYFDLKERRAIPMTGGMKLEAQKLIAARG
jgi:acyl-CoA thioester hydrolase